MSTTAMEAAALNKPVIALDLSGDQDTARYVSEGIAIGVYKSDDLTTAIKNLLENDSLLAKRRESYVLEHLYKIDGKASERVVDLIIKAIS
jgi:UDP-N-acetylglucosamine 2-epimerase